MLAYAKEIRSKVDHLWEAINVLGFLSKNPQQPIKSFSLF